MPPVALVRDKHLGRRAEAKAHYHKTASRELPPLTWTTSVHQAKRPSPWERWDRGEVLEEVTPRSYVVKKPDGLVRRNRVHLRPAEPSVPCNLQTLEQPAAGVMSRIERSDENY